MFLQSDWPTIAAANLPSGGAAYPLSTPGVRLKVDPIKDVTLLLAVLNGDPAGPGRDDEQNRNRRGLNFRVKDPAFIIGEAQFRRNIGRKDEGLATTLKLGGWGHLGQFDDKRFAAGGVLLADPAGSGVAIQHKGNSGFYAILDQQLYRPKGGDSQSGISVFSRVSFSPSDRNLIVAQIDGGVVFAGMIPHRPGRQVRRERSLRAILRQHPRLRPRHGDIHRHAGSDPRLRNQSRIHLCRRRSSRDGRCSRPCSSSGIRAAKPARMRPSPARVRSGDIEKLLDGDARPAVRHQPLLRQEAALVVHLARARAPSSRDRRRAGPCAARARCGRGS